MKALTLWVFRGNPKHLEEEKVLRILKTLIVTLYKHLGNGGDWLLSIRQACRHYLHERLEGVRKVYISGYRTKYEYLKYNWQEWERFHTSIGRVSDKIAQDLDLGSKQIGGAYMYNETEKCEWDAISDIFSKAIDRQNISKSDIEKMIVETKNEILRLLTLS